MLSDKKKQHKNNIEDSAKSATKLLTAIQVLVSSQSVVNVVTATCECLITFQSYLSTQLRSLSNNHLTFFTINTRFMISKGKDLKSGLGLFTIVKTTQSFLFLAVSF